MLSAERFIVVIQVVFDGEAPVQIPVSCVGDTLTCGWGGKECVP